MPGIFAGTFGTILLVVGVLLVVGIGFFVIRRRYSDDGTDAESGEGRVAHRDDTHDDYAIPTRKRVAGMTGPAKWALVGVTVILAVVAWNVYTYMKTGSPTQMAYATETQMAVAAVVAAGGGIAYERRRSRSEGRVDIIHEASPEDGRAEESTQTIYYCNSDVIEDGHGLVVHEYKRNRLLGLWRQPKRVADDRRLRSDGDVHRPLTDKVAHRIPDHATEVEDDYWVFYTQGNQVTASPNAVADYEYRPPHSLSNEQKHRIQSNIEMMETEVREKRATLAHKDAKIRRLEQALKNSMTEDWTQFLEIIERLAPVIGSSARTDQILQKLPEGAFSGHSGRSNGDGEVAEKLLQNGSGQGGEH